MASRTLKAVAALLAIALLAGPALAQVWRGPARMEGLVRDEKGTPIAGATVDLRMKGQSSGPNTKTDKKGRWAVLGLAGGDWDLDINADGYIPKKLGGIHLSEVSTIRLSPIDVQLQPVPKAVPQESAGVKEPGVPKETIEAIKQGDELLMAGKNAEAALEYEKALPSLPNHVPLLMQMARAYHGAKSETKSTEMLKLVLEKEPDNVAALLLLGNSSLERGDLEAGKAYLDKVPASAITDPVAYTNIGILYMNKNKPAEAEDYFTRAIQLDASYADGYYYRGLARYQAKKYQESKADLVHFLQAKPDAPEAKEVKELLSAIK
jgi:tetratricopeptide (TPR) repeat protein